MKRSYEEWSPGSDAFRDVRRAEAICDEYREAGYTLTLRQLYYQFVARGFIPNTDRSYKRLGSVIDRGRKAGYLDWSMIEDRTRNLKGNSHWETPGDVIQAAARSYGIDLWDDQPTRVEVWVEKEALAGIVEQSAQRRDCSWFSCRGYVSQSEMWGAAQRIGAYLASGQRVVVLHLGDHDPSGIDMTRDITDRLKLFVMGDAADSIGVSWQTPEDRDGNETEVLDVLAEPVYAEHGDDVDSINYFTDLLEVRRIALNIDQVRQYNPPPNPAKITDSRAGGYINRYGRESWELDALPPDVLDALITDHIDREMDVERFNARRDQQETDRDLLNVVSGNWEGVAEWVTEE